MRSLSLVLSVCLVGCQTQGYQQYADTMARIAEAQAQADKERFNAIMHLATTGGEATRTVAVVMLAMGSNGGKTQQQVIPPQNEALQWAQVILPSVSTLALGYWGYHLGKTQSNNAADVSIAGYGAMNGIAQSGFNAVGQFKPIPFDWSKIPVTNQTTTTTTNNIDNRDGNVIVGTGQISQDNSPVVVVPPVVQVVPVINNP